MAFFDYGILGINARNLLYIRPFNRKKAIRLADDKLKSKHFLSARGIPVPKLFAVIHSSEELSKFNFASLPGSFVLKPNMGFGGEGIIPVLDHKDKSFIKSNGDSISFDKMEEHIEDILEGRFSISGLPDTAFFEQRIVCDERLAKYAYKGLPDIRVVVHNLIPVMAMLRLPTRESEGKANLHQGAVGVGIDIARGTATHIIYRDKIVDEIPEYGPIYGFKVPYWDEILLIASKIQFVTNLGYLAVDIALDLNNGPMLLEINARAGLNVQLANLAPLRRRLERIQGVHVTTPEKGVRIAQDMFGNKVEKDLKKNSGKEVIGTEEQVKLLLPNEARYIWANVNPLLDQSIFSKKLADELGLKAEPGSDQLKLKFIISDTRVQTVVRLENVKESDFPLILGKKDLQAFLIDPTKGRTKINKLPHFALLEDLSSVIPSAYLKMDQDLVRLDEQIKLLQNLKPINLIEQKHLFFKNRDYNPQFRYRDIPYPRFELEDSLKRMRSQVDDSEIGRLFQGKIDELEKKVKLLSKLGTNRFTEASEDLFGVPSPELITAAHEKLSQKPSSFAPENENISMKEAVVEFEKTLSHYGLGLWHVKINKNMVASCSVGKDNTLFIKHDALFSENRLRMLIAHEIETHILTAENGKHQPFLLFNRGFGQYLQTQEGLAIWNQEQVLSNDVEKNYRSAVLVFVLDFALKHSFVETYDYCLKLGMTEDRAFQSTVKMKRGHEDTGLPGAFTKDLLYFQGYLQVQKYIGNGGNLKDLYYGKFNLKDLGLIKKIPHLKEPFVLPRFLKEV